MPRPKISTQSFSKRDIYLDGNDWENCEFNECNIILERGDFSVVNCDFIKCKLTMKGPAIAITKIIKLFYPELPINE